MPEDDDDGTNCARMYNLNRPNPPPPYYNPTPFYNRYRSNHAHHPGGRLDRARGD
jgi:hypothetical protein